MPAEREGRRMKWRSSNVLYLIGIGLPLLVIAELIIKIAWPSVWGCAAIIVITVLLLKSLIRKVRFLPRALEEYGELIPVELDLPGNPDVEVYSSNALCQYDFVLRIAEFLSPFSFGDTKPKVVINPQLLKEKGKRFMEMAVMREIERYRRNYQVSTILHLFLPLSFLAILVLSVFAFKIPVLEYLGPFWLYFAMPFLLTFLFGLHLFTWNRSLSIKDYQLDSYLASLFGLKEVKQFIMSVAELERRGEKQHHAPVNHHYISQRLKKLEELKVVR